MTVNEQIKPQDINLPEPNMALSFQLPPNANAIVDETKINVLIKFSQETLPEPETMVTGSDADQGSDTEKINYFEDNYIREMVAEIPD